MNAIVNRPEQQGKLVRCADFDQLQKTMIRYLIDSRDKIGGIIDERSVIAAVQCFRNNPKLLECDPRSVFTAVVQAGAYGWMCDGITGHASVVPFRQGKNSDGTYKPSKATLIPGYKGLMDLVRRTGQCEPTMESIHEGDTYQYRGRFQEPLHIRSGDPNRRQRPITHAYVMGVFRGGMVKCFSWTREECIAHRDAHATNWKNAVKWSKSDAELRDNLWHEDNPGFPVMCMKSVMRHAINRGEFPISVKDLRLLAQEEEAVEGHVIADGGMSQEEAAALTFESPAGYHEPLTTEDTPSAYTAEPTLQPDEPGFKSKHPLQDHWEAKVRECTPDEIDVIARDAYENDGVDVRSLAAQRKEAIAAKASNKRQRPLPGE